MYHQRHPNFNLLFNYSSNTPARQLSADEKAFVGAHVERCDYCRSVVRDVQDYDALWDTMSSIPAESLEDDFARIRPTLPRPTGSRDRSEAGRHTYVKRTFNDLRFSSTAAIEDLPYAASTASTIVLPHGSLRNFTSFTVQGIQVSAFVNPQTGRVFLLLPDGQFESLVIDDGEYKLTFDDSSRLWEVVGLAFVDMDEFLQNASHSNEHTLKLNVMV